MDRLDQLTQIHLDVLKEIGNIGAGNAATALSELLNKKIDMSIPYIKIVDFNELIDLVGGPERLIVAVFLRIQGDAPGSMFFILSPEEADTLAQQLTGDNHFQTTLMEDNPLAYSALSEVGNILSGSYLSSLSDFTTLNLQPTVPTLVIDMAAAILMEGLVEISQESDYAIMIDTMIEEGENGGTQVKGHFFLLPDPESFAKIFRALGVQNQ